jgi:diguanylate cyclase (GGDEF)-like protein
MMVDWSKIPDILAIASLVCAFSSILKRNSRFWQDDETGSGLWLIGWALIVVHFLGYSFLPVPGLPGVLGSEIGTISLAAAAVFFMWATVPYPHNLSSRWMAAVLLSTYSMMVSLDAVDHAPNWLFDGFAALLALAPLAVSIGFCKEGIHPLRRISVGFQFLLGSFLLISNHTGFGSSLGMVNAVLFTAYLSCCVHFWYIHRKATAGSVISIGGFFAWASVFVIGTWMANSFPNIHIESEVWNLPKYVVAVGMLLLLLERQVEQTQYLALHDDLTRLANRRLYQDRLISAMERARRANSTMGLLLLDLDRFKDVNDTYGHHMGDLLLKEVSRRLEARVRRSDTLARTGGDEFSLVLEEPTLRRDAEALAIVLEKLLSQPFNLAGKRVTIGASIGVAIYPEDGLDFETLSIAADQMMYSAKQGEPATIEL